MQIWKDIEDYKGHYQISNYGNVAAAFWIGKKAKPHHEKAVEQIKNGIVVNVFVSIQEAARKGNFSATAICKVCKGKGNLHKGYKWRYKK